MKYNIFIGLYTGGKLVQETKSSTQKEFDD